MWIIIIGVAKLSYKVCAKYTQFEKSGNAGIVQVVLVCLTAWGIGLIQPLPPVSPPPQHNHKTLSAGTGCGKLVSTGTNLHSLAVFRSPVDPNTSPGPTKPIFGTTPISVNNWLAWRCAHRGRGRQTQRIHWQGSTTCTCCCTISYRPQSLGGRTIGRHVAQLRGILVFTFIWGSLPT